MAIWKEEQNVFGNFRRRDAAFPMLLRARLSCVEPDRPSTLAKKALASLKLARSCVELYSHIKYHSLEQRNRLTRKADMFALWDLPCLFRRVQICNWRRNVIHPCQLLFLGHCRHPHHLLL